LITERDGNLLWIADDKQQHDSGLPKIEVDGQGSLLDLQILRDFERSGNIFMTYANAQGR